MKLTIHDGKQWKFEQGDWKDGEDGWITPVDDRKANGEQGMQGYRFAFHREQAYLDFTAKFEFQQKAHSDVGLMFRAKGASNFYVLHFPCCGQACRAQHFWAALSMMDDNGYLRVFKRTMVNRINSMVNIWHTAEVEVKGDSLHVIIDGRGIFEAAGLEPLSGYVGLMNFNGANIRNVEVNGSPVGGFVWNDTGRPATNWFYPIIADELGKWQMPNNVIRTPSGELLLYFSVSKGYSEKASFYLSRSQDSGRTWMEPKLWWEKEGIWEGQHRYLHIFPDGRLKCVIFTDGVSKVQIMESVNDGHDWLEPVESVMQPIPGSMDKLHIGPQALINLSDGSLLMLSYGRVKDDIPDTTVYTWGSLHCQAFVCRSTDGGATWSEFTNIDGITNPDNGNVVQGNMDLTEVCGVQTGDGSVAAYIRPVYSPWMWETRSHDGGKTWEPCVRGPFPGYATPNMLRTRSGYLVMAHRLPGLTLDVSSDDGQTWTQAVTIDSGLWAMGSMLEVQPDVILYVYWDSFESRMRAQFIKITSDGIFPYRN